MNKCIFMFLLSCPLVAGTLTGKLTLTSGGAVAGGIVSAIDAAFHIKHHVVGFYGFLNPVSFIRWVAPKKYTSRRESYRQPTKTWLQ